MHPRHLPGGQDDADQRLNNELAQERGNRDGHDSDEEAMGHAEDDVHGQTTEARPEAAAGAEVLHGATQLAGDGRRMVDHLRLRLRVVGVQRLIDVIAVDADIDIRVGVLDGGQGRNDAVVGVLDL